MSLWYSCHNSFLKQLTFHMFPNTEILNVSESKTDLIFETSMPNTSKYQISVKSLEEFGSYKHLKFGLKHWLKYRLWCHTYVIAVMSQTFCYHCIEYIKFDTCANFHDHWNNNRKVIMGALMAPPSVLMNPPDVRMNPLVYA